jgi:hypothetical protein
MKKLTNNLRATDAKNIRHGIILGLICAILAYSAGFLAVKAWAATAVYTGNYENVTTPDGWDGVNCQYAVTNSGALFWRVYRGYRCPSRIEI